MATGLIAHFSSYTAGQDCVQRYLAASSLYEARKAVVLCAVLSIPTWSFFNLVGVALFSFYRHNPVSVSVTRHERPLEPAQSAQPCQSLQQGSKGLCC
jgi:uncharacterized sodium:solute symporter family permease YidK